MGIYLYANVRENLAYTKRSYLAFIRPGKKILQLNLNVFEKKILQAGSGKNQIYFNKSSPILVFNCLSVDVIFFSTMINKDGLGFCLEW